MTALPDAGVRRRALDPARSFVVQAPAGSGKTELLIQRYLVLLARVREPEQVIAISFTRKSAAEMRGRVVDLLRRAAGEEPADQAHRADTLELARAVLDRDRERGWSLVAQPRRLRIDTVDALNAWLARRLPVLAGAVAGVRVTEEAGSIYLRAARSCVDRFDERGELGRALRLSLAAVDNSLPRLERLLADVLPQRDQWLRLLGLADDQALRLEIQAALAAYTEATLARLEARLGQERQARLAVLLQHAASHAERPPAGIEHWQDPGIGDCDLEVRLAAWQAASRLLLTGRGGWRKEFRRKEGFGADQAQARELMRELRRELEGLDGLAEVLGEVAELPAPELSPRQAEALAGVRVILKHLLAELSVLFQRGRTVDFPELALASQRALGAVDAPSELLLALDRKVEHILVDEFQDTSHSQFGLLELLTAGWVQGDGRTLFLVGDPMQSIYRFRDADMSLFLSAAMNGVGSVPCEHLVLDSNFRSAPAVVDWVNGAFGGIFPAENEFDAGSVRYHRCDAVREAAPEQHVELHGVDGADLDREHAQVVALLERELTRDASQSIGILVQSRKHLAGLQARLRARGWPVQIVDVESLAQHQLGQDLLGLARALAHPGDRIAWLAVLHAPWCGLTWKDLHALCAERPDSTVWELMNDEAQVAELEADGRRRLCLLRDILLEAFACRGATPFSRWVEATWRHIGGPSCLTDPRELELADRFFAVLDEVASDGGIDDPALLEDAFANPAGQGAVPRGTGIEIMTIHRAKGLEFDSVIVFGLARHVRGPEARALSWHELRAGDEKSRLLLAPFAREDDRLVALLKRIAQRFDHAEQARLLYVAATRARERLYLVTGLPATGRKPRAGSLLDWLWPAFEPEFRGRRRALARPAVEAVGGAPLLERLAVLAAPSPPVLVGTPVPTGRIERPRFEWVGLAAIHVGTLVHEELRRIGEHGIDARTPGDIDSAAARFQRALALMGVPRDELEDATLRVQDVLKRVLADERGRWILAPHADARSELRLTVAGERGLEHLQLDRTFIAPDGTRWIVDYKTSEHAGGDVDGFIASEVERYRDQLERYGAAMAAIDPRPIRLALYFPLLTALRDWPAGGAKAP